MADVRELEIAVDAELRRRVAELARENARLRAQRDDLRVCLNRAQTGLAEWKRLATAQANAEPGRGPTPVAVCGRPIIRNNIRRGTCGLPFGHDTPNNPAPSPCRVVEQPPAPAPDDAEATHD